MKEFRENLFKRKTVLQPPNGTSIDAGVDLRLHSRVVATEINDDKNIDYIITESKSEHHA
jgi:hypothetical protein